MITSLYASNHAMSHEMMMIDHAVVLVSKLSTWRHQTFYFCATRYFTFFGGKEARMTLTYIWPVHGDDVTVETNDTTKHRAGGSSWKVQLQAAATETASKLMSGSVGEQIW